MEEIFTLNWAYFKVQLLLDPNPLQVAPRNPDQRVGVKPLHLGLA